MYKLARERIFGSSDDATSTGLFSSSISCISPY